MIADGVESDGKGNDDKGNDHRAGPHKGRRHLPDDVAHLLAPQFYVVYVILVAVHISKSCCGWLYFFSFALLLSDSR